MSLRRRRSPQRSRVSDPPVNIRTPNGGQRDSTRHRHRGRRRDSRDLRGRIRRPSRAEALPRALPFRRRVLGVAGEDWRDSRNSREKPAPSRHACERRGRGRDREKARAGGHQDLERRSRGRAVGARDGRARAHETGSACVRPARARPCRGPGDGDCEGRAALSRICAGRRSRSPGRVRGLRRA